MAKGLEPSAPAERVERVLDASAFLAFVLRETDGESVVLRGSAMSVVNWSEVVQKCLRGGIGVEGLRDTVEAHGLRLFDLTAGRAETTAALWERTRSHGLSLTDRACLALAAELGVPVVTADRAWREVGVGVEVVLIKA